MSERRFSFYSKLFIASDPIMVKNNSKEYFYDR